MPVWMARLAGVAMTLMVVGCAGQRTAERQQALAEAVAICKSAFPAGLHAHTADRVKCMSTAEDRIIGQFVAYPDLLNLKHQYDFDLAGKVDAGEISVQEAALKQAEERSKLQATFEQRRNARAIADAQTDQAFYSGMALLQSTRPVTTTCNRFGSTTSCKTQ